jgi:ABC-type Fe3+/spermidine/putrescine transport system ATPase subunit
MVAFEDVRLVDVSRHFGRRRAVSQISLTIRSGEILGLLGPNGAGKSTIIGMLATLVAPTSGSITYGGKAAHALGGRLRGAIGLLAHELHLYSELSARQNLTFFAGLHGLHAREAVDRGLAAAGLSDRADDEVSGFSRGMRQRLALERALLHDPRLVLMDEPDRHRSPAPPGRCRRDHRDGHARSGPGRRAREPSGCRTRRAADQGRACRAEPSCALSRADWQLRCSSRWPSWC